MPVHEQSGVVDHVVHLIAEHEANGLEQETPAGQRRMCLQRLLPVVIEQRHLAQLLQRQQTRAHAVIDVVRVVGDLVGQVAQLRLQAGRAAVEEPSGHAVGFQAFEPLRVVARTMFEDALAGLEAQVQTVKRRVSLLQFVHHAQALQVVLETPPVFGVWVGCERLHAGVQRVLARMPEWRMAQVVRQRNRLDQIFIELQGPRDAAPQLRHLERVRQTRAEKIAFMVQKYLGFVNQPAKRGGVDHAVPITLEGRARGSFSLRVPASLTLRRVTGVWRQRLHGSLRRSLHQARTLASITCATSASGADRTTALPGRSITTNLISPASDFLSTRIRVR